MCSMRARKSSRGSRSARSTAASWHLDRVAYAVGAICRMDEADQARLVVAACDSSAAHYEARSDPAEQDAANKWMANALAEYRRSLVDE